MGYAIEEASAWDRWQKATRDVSGGIETRLSGPVSSFRGSIQRFNVLGLSYSSIETNARATLRGRDTLEPGKRYHCLVYQARGRSMAKQGSRVAMLNPSDMVLLSPHENCDFINRGMIRHLSFSIPEAALHRALGDEDIPHAIPIAGDSALGSILAGLLLQVHGRSAELARFVTPTLDVAMASLLTPLIRETGNTDRGIERMPDIVSTMSVIRFVDANLRNANLSPKYIARALDCSVRHVHRAFEGTGMTISAYIKEERLKASANELRAPRHAADSITEIAMRWGFSEVSHFSRSFRDQFGYSPREYRELPAVTAVG
ncbi:MAG: helix-turn-helix domain-containing protein [Rhizobiaceae bacterium]|nr:helix-turn-helix domain-containing protein [Rhizobiaceae bacterium]